MLYEITHYILAKMPWLWNIVEWGNAEAFSVMYKKELETLPGVVEKYNEKFCVSLVTENDVKELAHFFSVQPVEAFQFFKPHDFDEKTLSKLTKRKSFLMFIVKEGDSIVGYFFLRCFVNGNAFKGRIVDEQHRNQGIAKLMGNVINDVVLHLGLKLFTTISPDNYASLASTKAVNDIRIIRTLKNGYYYIECSPKK